MALIYYGSLLAASLILSGIYIYMWHKHFDVNFTIVFTMVPISCLGYFLYGISGAIGEAVNAMKICYLGGSFLQIFILFSIFNLCAIEISRLLRILMFSICVIMYSSVLTIGYSDVFYSSMSYKIVEGIPVLYREYGYMHTLFFVFSVLFFLIGLIAVIYARFVKSQVPRTVVMLLILPDLICLVTFFLGRRIIQNIDLIPLGYVIAQLVYILIIYRVNLYDVANTVIDSMVKENAMGFVTFDFHYCYIGSNDSAKQIIPELAELAIDEVLGYGQSERKLRHYLDSFKRNPSNNQYVYILHNDEEDKEDDRIYNVNVAYLYEGNRKRGYIVSFTDDTEKQKYIRLLDNYNEKLKEEVEEKTRHIVDMHDNLIMSLAVMVESRDNSTGGHIKRTSQGVKILIDEILNEGQMSLSEEFCRDVIKAAPMHDLGKIAVDDAVLRKPGKFTPEEYEIMKKHAAEGARVIHDVLYNTDDESFKSIAENVAHYHHERWDGSGYPEGLVGEAIPIEARIMAVADVYDALVSKRVYKEAFDFEKADKIIMEGMGSQFDPAMKSIYEKARPRLEEYYKTL